MLFAVILACACACRADFVFAGLANLVKRAELIVVGQVVEQRSHMRPEFGIGVHASRIVVSQLLRGGIPKDRLWLSWMEDCGSHLELKVGSRAVFFLAKRGSQYHAVGDEEGVKLLDPNGYQFQPHQFADVDSRWQNAKLPEFIRYLKNVRMPRDSVNTGRAGDAQEATADEAVRQRIVEVGSYPVGPIDAELKSKVRRDLAGIEAQAVAFCLSAADSSDQLVNRGRIRTLAAPDEQALDQFRSAFLKTERPEHHRVRLLLWSWLRVTTSLEGFKFAVAKLITDMDLGERPNLKMEGRPRRICDHVYNTVRERLHGCDEFAAARGITNRDSLTSRDKRLQEFRRWWKANEERLEWSSDRSGFIVRSVKE